MLTLSDHDLRLLGELVNRYALLVDEGAYDQVADLFAVDGVLTSPEPPDRLRPVRDVRGRPAIKEELQRLDHFAMTFHGLAGQIFEATGPATARGKVNCIAHHVLAEGRDVRDLVWHLRYDDRYARSGAAWAITRREITIELIDARPAKRVNDRLDLTAQQDGHTTPTQEAR